MGNVAGQIVGNALGVEHGFDWKSVALSAFSACVAQGLIGVVDLGNAGMNLVAKLALLNAMTQGVAVVIGVQKGFSWANVAASAIGVGVGAGVNAAIGDSFGGTDFGRFAKGAVSGFAAGTATALDRGGHVSIQQVSVDAFSQALGNAAAEGIQNAGTQQDKLGDFIQQNQETWNQRQTNFDQIVGAFGNSNPYGVDRSNGVMLAAGLGYSGGINPESIASLRQSDGTYRLEINGAGLPSDFLTIPATGGNMSPTKANAMRLGLLGADGQTDGIWTSPVAQPHIVGASLPFISTPGEDLGAPSDSTMPYGQQMANVSRLVGNLGTDTLKGTWNGALNVLEMTTDFMLNGGAMPSDSIGYAPWANPLKLDYSIPGYGQAIETVTTLAGPLAASRMFGTSGIAAAEGTGTSAMRWQNNFYRDGSEYTYTTSNAVNARAIAGGREAPYMYDTPVIQGFAPAGTRETQVIMSKQADAILLRNENYIGSWSTTDLVLNQVYARENLAIIPKFKSDVEFTTQIETLRPTPYNRGIVGPMPGATGGGWQTEWLYPSAVKDAYVRPVPGSIKPLSEY